MTHSTLNPDALHDPSAFGYSHTARVPADSELVFVSGQYASGPDGAVVSDSFPDQVGRVLHNLSVALEAQGMQLSHVVSLRTYVVGLDFDKLGAISGAIGSAFETPPTQTLLGVAALATPEILVEIEAVAAR